MKKKDFLEFLDKLGVEKDGNTYTIGGMYCNAVLICGDSLEFNLYPTKNNGCYKKDIHCSINYGNIKDYFPKDRRIVIPYQDGWYDEGYCIPYSKDQYHIGMLTENEERKIKEDKQNAIYLSKCKSIASVIVAVFGEQEDYTKELDTIEEILDEVHDI